MKNRMFDILFTRQDDGAIRLVQTECGEESVIVLAPSQLRYIAMQVAGYREANAAKVEDGERKLGILTTGLEEFVCDSSIRAELLEYCPSSAELLERLDGLLNLAWEFGGRLSPDDMRRGDNTDQSNPRNHCRPPLQPLQTPSATVADQDDIFDEDGRICLDFSEINKRFSDEEAPAASDCPQPPLL